LPLLNLTRTPHHQETRILLGRHHYEDMLLLNPLIIHTGPQDFPLTLHSSSLYGIAHAIEAIALAKLVNDTWMDNNDFYTA
jgi:hypothetical protein